MGRWTRGAPGLKSCPLLPGEEFRRYNSLVDKEADPRIFVVQVTCADSLPLQHVVKHRGGCGRVSGQPHGSQVFKVSSDRRTTTRILLLELLLVLLQHRERLGVLHCFDNSRSRGFGHGC